MAEIPELLLRNLANPEYLQQTRPCFFYVSSTTTG